MKCLCCEKDFEIRPNGKSGGQNRQLCYDCLPEGIEDIKLRSSAGSYFLTKKISEEKIKRGCDICGYNKCAAALDWHHPDDNKEYNPSVLASKGNWEGYYLYKKETEKCQLLCANCHREIHDKQREEKVFVGSDKYEKFRKEVCDYYKQVKSIKKTSEHFHKDADAIKRILEFCNIEIYKYNNRVPVVMLDKETEKPIKEFDSMREAEDFIGKKNANVHISQCCNGIRKSAYGYKWKKKRN